MSVAAGCVIVCVRPWVGGVGKHDKALWKTCALVAYGWEGSCAALVPLLQLVWGIPEAPPCKAPVARVLVVTVSTCKCAWAPTPLLRPLPWWCVSVPRWARFAPVAVTGTRVLWLGQVPVVLVWAVEM